MYVDETRTLENRATELYAPTLNLLRSGREIAPDPLDTSLHPLRYRDRDVLWP